MMVAKDGKVTKDGSEGRDDSVLISLLKSRELTGCVNSGAIDCQRKRMSKRKSLVSSKTNFNTRKRSCKSGLNKCLHPRVITTFDNLVKQEPCFAQRVLLGFDATGNYLISLASASEIRAHKHIAISELKKGEVSLLLASSNTYGFRQFQFLEMWNFNLCDPSNLRFSCIIPVLGVDAIHMSQYYNSDRSLPLVVNNTAAGDVCVSFCMRTHTQQRVKRVAVTVSPVPNHVAQDKHNGGKYTIQGFAFDYTVEVPFPKVPTNQYLSQASNIDEDRFIAIPLNAKILFVVYKVISHSEMANVETETATNISETTSTQTTDAEGTKYKTGSDYENAQTFKKWWIPASVVAEEVNLKYLKDRQVYAEDRSNVEPTQSAGSKPNEVHVKLEAKLLKFYHFDAEDFLSEVFEKNKSLLDFENRKLIVKDYELLFVSFVPCDKCIMCVVVKADEQNITDVKVKVSCSIGFVVEFNLRNGDYQLAKILTKIHRDRNKKVDLSKLCQSLQKKERDLQNRNSYFGVTLTNQAVLNGSAVKYLVNPVHPVAVSFSG
mmetsp:Transcript_22743/g.29022  ORF Transcript_22743/g.29022 Transcript_22743/m.29022 type:complete len:546 (-) Transcript_22743:586-2223(-)